MGKKIITILCSKNFLDWVDASTDDISAPKNHQIDDYQCNVARCDVVLLLESNNQSDLVLQSLQKCYNFF